LEGWLLVNPRSGGGQQPDELCAAAAARGIDAHVLRPGEDAAVLARGAQADALGVAGGDGSLAAVAGAALERGLPFVCVPFGTRNHFARDLGLDRSDPVGALAGFAGEERRVDVGRAGDRLFLNNVSVGAYALLVHHGWRRVVDGVRLPLRLTLDDETVYTRVLLVASNAYSFTGARERLDEGRLHVYTARGEIRAAERVVVGAHGSQLRAAIDGEGALLETPVELSIEPRALRVLVPPPGPVP
jgi:diacylglycerol kinase family enzyme